MSHVAIRCKWELDNAHITEISEEEKNYIREWIRWCNGEREDKPVRN